MALKTFGENLPGQIRCVWRVVFLLYPLRACLSGLQAMTASGGIDICAVMNMYRRKWYYLYLLKYSKQDSGGLRKWVTDYTLATGLGVPFSSYSKTIM